MPKSLDIRAICLGILSFREASGYDLKKHFEGSFEAFYPASFGSIYPALESLVAEGLAECRTVTDGGKLRKLYRITPAGLTELTRALADCDPGHKLRSEFLAALCFAQLMTPDKVAALVDARLAEIDAKLAANADMQQRIAADHDPHVRFVIGYVVNSLKASRDYIARHRDLLVESAAAEAAPSQSKSLKQSRRRA